MLRREEWEQFAKEFTELTGLGTETLELIPIYARPGAASAIRRVQELARQSVLRPGVYYVVLCDLCGSTIALEKLGQELGVARIQGFVLATIQALDKVRLDSVALPLKEAGDAMIFLFTSFKDVLSWWNRLQSELTEMTSEYLHEHGDGLEEDEEALFSLTARTVMHLGEVDFPHGANPIALAISQTFKLEKSFGEGELGCSELVRTVAEPLLRELGLTCESRGHAKLSEDTELALWSLVPGGHTQAVTKD